MGRILHNRRRATKRQTNITFISRKSAIRKGKRQGANISFRGMQINAGNY